MFLLTRRLPLLALLIGMSVATELPGAANAPDHRAANVSTLPDATVAANFPLSALPIAGTKVPNPGQAVYDVGDVILESLKQPIRHDFVIRNSSNADAIIDRVHPECECTSAVLRGGTPGAPYILHPGEQVTVSVSINPKLLGPGILDKSTTIYLAGQPQPVLTLHIAGNINSAATYDPSNFYFGDVRTGTSPSTTFTLELDRRFYRQNAPDPVCADPDFTLVRDSQARLPARPGKIVRQYTVTVSPRGRLGFRQTVIAMRDKVGSLGAGEFAVAAIVTGDIASDATGVSFGAVKPNASSTQDIEITAANAKAFQGLAVTCAGDELTTSIMPPKTDPGQAAAGTVTITVTLTPHRLGPFQSHIDIRTQSGQVLELPVWASVQSDVNVDTLRKPTPDMLKQRSGR